MAFLGGRGEGREGVLIYFVGVCVFLFYFLFIYFIFLCACAVWKVDVLRFCLVCFCCCALLKRCPVRGTLGGWRGMADVRVERSRGGDGTSGIINNTPSCTCDRRQPYRIYVCVFLLLMLTHFVSFRVWCDDCNCVDTFADTPSSRGDEEKDPSGTSRVSRRKNNPEKEIAIMYEYHMLATFFFCDLIFHVLWPSVWCDKNMTIDTVFDSVFFIYTHLQLANQIPPVVTRKNNDANP